MLVDRYGARRSERDVPPIWGVTSAPFARVEATRLERPSSGGETWETGSDRTGAGGHVGRANGIRTARLGSLRWVLTGREVPGAKHHRGMGKPRCAVGRVTKGVRGRRQGLGTRTIPLGVFAGPELRSSRAAWFGSCRRPKRVVGRNTAPLRHRGKRLAKRNSGTNLRYGRMRLCVVRAQHGRGTCGR